jgi:hypothetical protein
MGAPVGVAVSTIDADTIVAGARNARFLREVIRLEAV